MWKAVILISVLVLRSTWTLKELPVEDVEVEDSVEPLASAEVDNAPFGKATEFKAAEACTAAPEGGRCKGNVPRYFYNSTTMSCEVFIYGGCGGNQNNFKTEKACMEGCHPEEACTAAPDIGTCKGNFPRYFHNSTSMSCEVFIYGGCGGNQNNFKHEKECLERCHPEEVCTAAPDIGTCKGNFPRYFYNSNSMTCEVFIYGGCGGNQNNFKHEKECLDRCHIKGKLLPEAI